MDEIPPQPGFPERAADSLTDASRVVRSTADDAVAIVRSATDDVVAVGRHLKDAVDATRRPGGPLWMLEKLTRAAPLAMLGIAFIAGALFASGRQRP